MADKIDSDLTAKMRELRLHMWEAHIRTTNLRAMVYTKNVTGPVAEAAVHMGNADLELAKCIASMRTAYDLIHPDRRICTSCGGEISSMDANRCEPCRHDD